MYNNGFIIAVNYQNKFLNERADKSVLIPFDSEYSLRLRNNHARRALVKIYIDGENVSGGGYIIDAKGFIDIERFYDVAKKFKFVATDSSDAVEFGKNGPNDDKSKGVIRAEFYLEKENSSLEKINTIKKLVEEHHHHHYHHHRHPRYPFLPYYVANSTVSYDTALNSCSSEQLARSFKQISGEIMPRGCDFPAGNDGLKERDGCTVQGQVSNQNFINDYINIETTPTICTIILRGYDPVATPANKAPKSVNAEIQSLEEQLATLQKKLELQQKIKELQAQLQDL